MHAGTLHNFLGLKVARRVQTRGFQEEEEEEEEEEEKGSAVVVDNCGIVVTVMLQTILRCSFCTYLKW